MRQNFIDDVLILNTRGDFYESVVMISNLDNGIEEALELLCTGHCDMTLCCGASVSISGSNRPILGVLSISN